MIYIVLFILIFICIISPTFRCALFHPFKTIINAVIDIYKYFKYKKWNEAEYGEIVGYIADNGRKFGCGKTLTAVEFLTSLYDKYNDKIVWCKERKKFVTQKIQILSNVTLTTIPFINFISLGQYVSLLNKTVETDKENDTLTVTYAFIDEASSILNSRSFKDNLSAPVISSIVTCRHMHSGLIYSTQKPKLTDCLLRTVTSYYVGCDKLWRFQRTNYYDSDSLEYAVDPTIVQPFKRGCWFIENKHFAKYDSFELLKTIEKKCEEGDMMSEEEILTHLQMPEPNADNIINTSRKYRKSRKKLTK